MNKESANKQKKFKTKQIQKQPKQTKNKISNKKDKRFESAAYDPKFVAPKATITKVKIDKRFADRLQTDKFQISNTVDKYGRKQQQKNQLAGMSDYYYTQDQPQIQQQIQIQKNNKAKLNKINKRQLKNIKTIENKKNQQIQQQQQQFENKDQGEDGIQRWMQQYNQQSSSDLDEQDIDEMVQDSDSLWSDKSQHLIKNQNVQVTRRLALCNYDWMNIEAKDLMILFSSFKPTAGTILGVKVYYSQLGMQKLKQQDRYGPQGIWNQQAQIKQKQKKQKQVKLTKYQATKQKKYQQQAFNQKKLRAYEKQRLKYCYAIIECNNKKTADQIYKECDGNQFQNSNIQFDIRFVPDDIKFDANTLKQKCDQLPVSGQVKNFVSRALGHSSVALTWQDPQLNGIANLKKKNWNKMTDKEMENIDWGMYINQQDQNADDNYNKLLNKKQQKSQNDIQIQFQSQQQNINVSDWRKQCNKKYKKKTNDIQITFPSGFDSQIGNKKQKQSLNKQLKTRKQRWRQIQDEKKNRQQMELLVQKNEKQDFIYNPKDQRFKAVLDNPSYYIDPSNPKFDHRKVGAVFQEVVKHNKKKNLQ